MYPQAPLFLDQISAGRTTCYSCVNRMIAALLYRLTHIKAACVTLFLWGFSKNTVKPEKFTTWGQPKPLFPSDPEPNHRRFGQAVECVHHRGLGRHGTTNHPFTRGVLKFSHSQVKRGPTTQGGSHQGCLLAGSDRFSAGILEHSHPESPPSLQCSGLAAVLGREAPGWGLLGALSAHRASWSSDLQDTQDLGSGEQSQKRLWGDLCWEESSRHQFVTDADATSLLQKEPLALSGLI